MRIPASVFTGYGRLLRDSWLRIWRRPLVFFPVIYGMFLELAFFALFVMLGSMFFGSSITLTRENVGWVSLYFLLSAVVFVVSMTHVGSLFVAVMTRVAKGKPVSFGPAFKEGAGLFWRFLRLVVSQFVIFIPIGTFFGAVGFIIASVGLSRSELIILLGLLYLIMGVFLKAWFLFSYPMLGAGKDGAWRIVSQSWFLLGNDFRHVFLTFFSVLGVSAVIFLVEFIISAPFSLQEAHFINTILQLCFFVANLVLLVWMSLFVFRSFHARYKGL